MSPYYFILFKTFNYSDLKETAEWLSHFLGIFAREVQHVHMSCRKGIPANANKISDRYNKTVI